jgi:thiosulfate/3-mercaptopyruvate sulfurtransferase
MDNATYAYPEVLVSTDWVRQNIGQAGIRMIEIDVDSRAYEAGHIPGAVGFNWQTQLQDQLRRDIISQQGFEELLGGAGILPDETVVLYGDNYNWFAAYGFWLFKLYGHKDVRLMNGGRVKWLSEPDKPLTGEKPVRKAVRYAASEPLKGYRAFVPQVFEAVGGDMWNLVDVRSHEEFTGKLIAPPGMSESAQRGGHIPKARNIPWSRAVHHDGTFRSAAELRRIYLDESGLDPRKRTITYCRIGERSSHTWFVLTYLLGMETSNYDGSWTEYGNLIAAPIER